MIYFKNIEYGWNKPQSLIVFVPGLSLIAYKIQKVNLDEHLKKEKEESDFSFLKSKQIQKLDTLNKWHFFGSFVQVIFLLALTILIPFLILPAFSSIYELRLTANNLWPRELQQTSKMIEI